MFVDVCTVVAHSKKDLKVSSGIISLFSSLKLCLDKALNFVLTINFSENKIMC